MCEGCSGVEWLIPRGMATKRPRCRFFICTSNVAKGTVAMAIRIYINSTVRPRTRMSLDNDAFTSIPKTK